MEFLFQIKGKCESGISNWSFPPIWTDKVEAKDRQEAKDIICEMYGVKFPMRVLVSDLASHEFLLTIKEIKENDYYTKSLFEVKECKTCGHKYKVIEKYQIGSEGGGRDYCSTSCLQESSKVERYKGAGILDNQVSIHKPCIYKITHLPTGKNYIGKTTQVFTLRWYQHFFQSLNSDTKFHAIIKQSLTTDWTFQVIEVIEFANDTKRIKEAEAHILERETYWMNHYDSINHGFNSMASVADVPIELPSLFQTES